MENIKKIDAKLVESVALVLYNLNSIPESEADGMIRLSPMQRIANRSAIQLLNKQSELFEFCFVCFKARNSSRDCLFTILFISHVIWETFRTAGWRNRPIDRGKICATLGENYRVHLADSRFLSKYIQNMNFLRQPALLLYIHNALENNHSTCPCGELSKKEKYDLFIFLKTIVDVIDDDFQEQIKEAI